MMFQIQEGDWKDLRQRFDLRPADEIDLHFGRRDPDIPYWQAMNDIGRLVERAVREAHTTGRRYLKLKQRKEKDPAAKVVEDAP